MAGGDSLSTRACIALIGGLAAAFAVVRPCPALPGDETPCISATERAQVKRTYDDYQSRFGMTAVARQLVDFDHELRVLNEQLAECRKLPPADLPKRCDALVSQVAAKQREQESLTGRFNAAIKLQSYLATLELRLAQPPCGE